MGRKETWSAEPVSKREANLGDSVFTNRGLKRMHGNMGLKAWNLEKESPPIGKPPDLCEKGRLALQKLVAESQYMGHLATLTNWALSPRQAANYSVLHSLSLDLPIA